MVLSGVLSNPDFQDLINSLTGENLRQTSRSKPKRTPAWGDGRRKFGEVSGAIVAVLAAADAELPVKAIHAGVEGLLNGNVFRYSVSDFLLVRSKGPEPLFLRTRFGHYRLR
jgi:hypothetical protein